MDYKTAIEEELERFTGISGITLESPKDKSLGDFAFPCFVFAAAKKKSPVQIAQEVASQFFLENVTATAVGPYVNFKVTDTSRLAEIVAQARQGIVFSQVQNPETVLVESPGPNTNKPLHLGHLRNMLLGKTAFSLLKAVGEDVHVVNVVNDRGIHICKSMLAYQLWGGDATPESANMKPDHFVGSWYVKFAQEAAKNDEAKAVLESQAQDLLRKWEAGDEPTLALWKKMNDWCLAGFAQTYERLHITIEQEWLESETYTGGKDIVLKGLEEGIFFKDEHGAICIDLEDQKLGKKVLLRGDGTAIYITQDINMARLRYDAYQFDRMIYVVGNEQEYHFKVLFEVFKALGWSFGSKCTHFSYGMIELPEGKMKSREGNVIDTDQLLDQMQELAVIAITERYADLSEEEVLSRAEMIAKSSVYFFFLKQDPLKNFVFDPKNSLSFEGETGPYVQYTHARIASILRKNDADVAVDYSLLSLDQEQQLIKDLALFDEVVMRAATELKPHLVCHYVLALSQSFNKYYGNTKVIQEDKVLQATRCALLEAIKNTLAKCLELLDIEAPDVM